MFRKYPKDVNKKHHDQQHMKAIRQRENKYKKMKEEQEKPKGN